MLGWKGTLKEAFEPSVDQFRGEAEKVLKIKTLCLIAKVSAKSYGYMSPEEQAQEFGQYEYSRYRNFLSDAIGLADELSDEFYRNSALHFILNLLMVAKEYVLAKKLYQVIKVDIIQKAILKDHPQLASRDDQGSPDGL